MKVVRFFKNLAAKKAARVTAKVVFWLQLAAFVIGIALGIYALVAANCLNPLNRVLVSILSW